MSVKGTKILTISVPIPIRFYFMNWSSSIIIWSIKITSQMGQDFDNFYILIYPYI